MTVPLKINVLPEPKVQFSDGKTDVDPRRGLEKFKPADYLGERKITLGVVGLKDDTEAAAGWLGRFSRFSPGQEKKLETLPRLAGLKYCSRSGIQATKTPTTCCQSRAIFSCNEKSEDR